MSFGDLFFLASGGVIGSGWLFEVQTEQRAGAWAVALWLIVGALVFVVAIVMVKLSIAVPRNGGLVFLPWKTGGPLLATVVAVSVWGFYASNPPSEAIAVVRDLRTYWHLHGLVKANSNDLTWPGIGIAALFMLLMVAVTLLGPRRFLQINIALTAFKILVPLLVIALLAYAEIRSPSLPPSPPRSASARNYGASSVLSAVTGSGIIGGGMIYAYLGFQGPLDFAGNVRRRGIGEAKRLKRAVYATVLGSILLYACLQIVPVYMRSRFGEAGTYIEFVNTVAPGWAGAAVITLIRLDTLLAPVGTGMIFVYVLTREVAAFSAAHLTHRGLQLSKYSVIPLTSSRLRRLFDDDRLDVFWLIVIVDFIISAIMLYVVGNWSVFASITSVLALIAYATPSVVLVTLKRMEPERFPGRGYSVLATVGFVMISVIFFLLGWEQLWPGMATLTGGCLLLFSLPLVARRPPWARWYDVDPEADAAKFLQWRNPAPQSALVLFGYFSLSTLASLLSKYAWPGNLGAELGIAAILAVLAWLSFSRLVELSVKYMEDNRPKLPDAMPSAAGPGPTPGTATAPAG
ncbi:MAG: APC family permease [Nocardiopsaceae bacterium]|nr:APC family permease [Nocardiopsaceae bacterium]